MSTNPYAPPNAVVADIPVADVTHEAPLFAVSAFKLVIMSVFTLGLYQIYWFYRNWTCIKERDRSRILPALRSIFGIIYHDPNDSIKGRNWAWIACGGLLLAAGVIGTLLPDLVSG
jgi:hypothetical protein